jgi:hypothetical protein
MYDRRQFPIESSRAENTRRMIEQYREFGVIL